MGESVAIITAAGAVPAGVVIALDRQERGQDERSAASEIFVRFGVPVVSIIALDDIVDYLQADPTQSTTLAAINAYRATYGVRD